ncbi:hypothetical protein RHSIM_Rhsim11G0147000 [Rhododendron simsii]|uniref:Uncharacterized protein n=1 Tax=Rhododendron simsii TaxID=118357 RepID=A0A834LAH7_RHOSS|nr:hypothetical protein RHSIM_Rhsim11G0147000 [Rhododendron simsii]
MVNLKRKVEYLSGQKNDINSQMKDQVCWPGKRPGIRPKKEVEIWLTDVQQFKDDVQRLEQEVYRETNVSSRTRLGKVIAKKILEVQELQRKGSDFDGLTVDELPISYRVDSKAAFSVSSLVVPDSRIIESYSTSLVYDIELGRSYSEWISTHKQGFGPLFCVQLWISRNLSDWGHFEPY